MSDTNQPQASYQEPQLLGHPKGLFYLFFAELWERFSFYGMRALLMLYMVNELFKALENADAVAIGVYASYGTLVYATPVIGGMISDRLLGNRRAILLGGVLMTIGHAVMAIESQTFFFLALGFLIVGNGFFKPNISTFVGSLYREGDPRRDAGFTIFYMGINVGAFVAPIFCGWLAINYGWHYGFGAAGIGMLSGVLVFWKGLKSNIFGDHGLPASEEALEKTYLGIKAKIWVPLVTFLVVPMIAYMIYAGDFVFQVFGTELYEGTVVSFLFKFVLLLVVAYVVYVMVNVSVKERFRLVVIFFMTFFMTLFWAFYELSGSLITLFADRNVNLVWFTASGTNAITAAFIILFAMVYSRLWLFLSARGLNPRTPYKFAIGTALIGFGFLVLSLSAGFADEFGRVPFIFMVLGYFLFTQGELFMSPVGLSKVTELAPKKFVSFMMGIWFISSAFAFDIGGFIGRKMAITAADPTQKIEGFESLAIYTTGFEQIGYVALIGAVLALILSPIMNRWMYGIH